MLNIIVLSVQSASSELFFSLWALSYNSETNLNVTGIEGNIAFSIISMLNK